MGLQACPAAQVIKKQLTEGVTQRRVGLVSTGAPPRAHSLILNQEGKEVRLPPRSILFCKILQGQSLDALMQAS